MERNRNRPDEADLPAQEAPPRQGARLSRPDEVDRGPSCPGSAPGSWSEATDGLTDERGPNSPRLVMLSSPQDFAALAGTGTYRSHQLLAVRIRRTDLGVTRFGLATGRNLGNAVVRNRVRRRLRAVLREMSLTFRPGWDVLIIARPGIVDAGHDAVQGAVRRLLERDGVLEGSAA